MTPAVGWYFHLPPCSRAFEVDALIENSLSLMLEAHVDARFPVALAITGSLLSLMEGRHDKCIQSIQAAIQSGIVQPVGTTYVETCAPLLSGEWLARQVDADLAIKQQLWGVRPQLFWPGNLAWSPALGSVLLEKGFTAAIADELHLRQARETQLWKWLGGGALKMASVLIEADDDLRAPQKFELKLHHGTLEIMVPSAALRLALTFGTAGAIHHAWDDQPLDAVLQAWPLFDGLACIDDGDRVNAISIHQYRRLLRSLSGQIVEQRTAPRSLRPEVIEFLPAWLPGGQEFWGDVVASAYLRQLDALYRLIDAGRVTADEVLVLQDVFPLFWKRHARGAWFHDRVHELIARRFT